MINSPSKSPLRRLVEQETGYEVLISASAWHSLAKRAGKNSVPLSIVEQVYARGYLSADENSKNSPEQQAFQRVDSFLHGGQAQNLDEDLINEIKVPNGSRHMHIIKQAVKRYESKKNPITEDTFDEEGVYPAGYKAARWIYRRVKDARKRQAQSKAEAETSSETPKPKRRMYKYEKDEHDKDIRKRIVRRSVEQTKARQSKLAKDTGISLKKIQRGHGSGPLDPDELRKLKTAEEGKPVTRAKAKNPVPKTKGRYREKLAVWAVKKLRDTRKKYENE